MNKPSHLTLWIALFIAVILGSLWQFYPLASASDRTLTLPLNGIHYRGTDLPLSPFEEKFFLGVNVLKRLYQIGDQKFFITILDGTSNRHVVHDPYYCFKGGGWDITDDVPFKLPHGQSSLITIKRDDVVKKAMYWFSNSKEQYTSPFHYWLQATLRRLTLGRSSPEPVLIMIQPTGTEPVDWNKVLENFPAITQV